MEPKPLPPVFGQGSPENSHRGKRLLKPEIWERLPKIVRWGLMGFGVLVVIVGLFLLVHSISKLYKPEGSAPQAPQFGLTGSGNLGGGTPAGTGTRSGGKTVGGSGGSAAPPAPTSGVGSTSGPTAPPALTGYSIVFDSNRTGNFEIFKQAPGGKAVQLTSNGAYDSWWAKPSPNGSQILFYRTPAGVHDSNYGKTSLWMMNSDGTNQRQIIANGAHGWGIQGHGEWSPDGTQLIMFGGPTIWITDTSGNPQRSVTTGLDPTFTPDGQHVLYINCAVITGCTQPGYRVFRANLDGTGATQLENLPYRANDPFTSPDGNSIVWETNISGSVWDIAIMNSDGTNAHILFADNNINTNPTWSPKNAIFFFKTEPGKYSGYGLWVMNRDASGLQLISAGQPGSNEYVSVIP